MMEDSMVGQGACDCLGGLGGSEVPGCLASIGYCAVCMLSGVQRVYILPR